MRNQKSEIPISKYLMRLLEQEGWHYEVDEEAIHCMISYKTRKWRVVFRCQANVCSCYSFFPWTFEEKKMDDFERAINRINSEQMRATFFIEQLMCDSYVVMRCSNVILDDFVIEDYLRELLLTQVAITMHYWDMIYEMINSIKR